MCTALNISGNNNNTRCYGYFAISLPMKQNHNRGTSSTFWLLTDIISPRVTYVQTRYYTSDR